MDFAGFDLGKVKDMARKGIDRARQMAEGLNELEMKVEEATNNDKWGPHGSLMQELTKRSFNIEEYKQILAILARRLHSEPNHWRHVYKSLLLLEFMAKNGPKRLVPELKSNGKVFTRLQKFEYIDSQGKDQGLNVRNRAKQLWDLVHDEDAIARERDTAAKNRNKYSGYDKSTAAFAGRGSYGVSTGGSRPTSATPNASLSSTTGATTPADATPPTDAVAATEARLSKLSVEDAADSPERTDSGAGATALPTPTRVRSKPKLSQILADSSIAGSIAAMAQKLPMAAPPPRASGSMDGSAAGKVTEDTGMNLLDFGDDDSTSSQPAAEAQNGVAAALAIAAADPLAMLDELDAPAAPPAALPAQAGGDDWAPFAAAGAGAGDAAVGAAGDDDWAAFVSSGAPAASAPTGGGGDDWNACTAPVGHGGSSGPGAGGAFADPFASMAPAANVGARVASAAPASSSRGPLPMDAFTAPLVEPLPVTPGPTMPRATLGWGLPSDSRNAPTEKDPFADLLG